MNNFKLYRIKKLTSILIITPTIIYILYKFIEFVIVVTFNNIYLFDRALENSYNGVGDL